jgi:nucleoid-associated protein EbfC
VFPGPGASGQPDMAELLRQAQAMQQQLIAAQDELARAEVTGTAGGGLVTATVTGTGEVVSLRIAPAACDPADADLVLAAIRDATRAASSLQASTMGPLSQGLGGGFGLSEPGGLPGPDGD